MSDQDTPPLTQNATEQIVEEETLLSFVQHLLFEVFTVWDSWLDFRLKLFVVLFAWLCINIGLIRVAWRVYGTKVTETFGNEGRIPGFVPWQL